MGNRLNIPVEELKLGADDDASTLATRETSAKNLVYIMNIQEGKLGTPQKTHKIPVRIQVNRMTRRIVL